MNRKQTTLWVPESDELSQVMHAITLLPDRADIIIGATDVSLWNMLAYYLSPFTKVSTVKLKGYSFDRETLNVRRALCDLNVARTIEHIKEMLERYDIIETPPFISPIARSLLDWSPNTRYLNSTLHYYGDNPLMIFTCQDVLDRIGTTQTYNIVLDKQSQIDAETMANMLLNLATKARGYTPKNEEQSVS